MMDGPNPTILIADRDEDSRVSTYSVAAFRQGGATIKLNDHGIYKLPDGREFVVRVGTHGGYILHDIRLGVASAPVYLIDGSGQFLSWGRPTRWSLAELSDTGRTSTPEIQRLKLL